MKFLSPIDPHVHLRNQEYPDHDFLGMALEDAETVGLAGLIEMPNTTPWLTTRDAINKRLDQLMVISKARKPIRMMPWFGIHAGLTTDLKQVASLIEMYYGAKNGGIIRGLKIFFAGSTNSMTCSDPEYQQRLWSILAASNYRGVVIGHFEDENEYSKDRPFDPLRPETHSEYQGPYAEVKSVETQLRNAVDANFRGTFYIAHCTTPATVDLVRWARKIVQFKIVIEVTWHHLLLNTDAYHTHGNRVKMNPPLRHRRVQEDLIGKLCASDDIDLIGTDHAPHPLSRKDDKKAPASGIPALPFWPEGIRHLYRRGCDRKRIDDLTFNNANRIFNLNLQPDEVDKQYQPELWERYGFNPFSMVQE